MAENVPMNGNNRSDIAPGMRVRVVRKEDQRNDALTEGVVRDLLTKSSYHPHGIKVRLEDGIVGRVKEILGDGRRSPGGPVDRWPPPRQVKQGLKPPADAEEKFRELLSIIARLRGPDGCPWDRAQTKPDMGRYLIDEAYEVIEALEEYSPENLREELGDLLFQILFLARMAEEAGEFNIADVLGEITAKMVRRHPHIFGDAMVDNIEEVRANWERIKTEVEHKRQPESRVCGGIPRFLPTLSKAQRITARAAEAGFDWKDVGGVLDKVAEELAEFRAALESKEPARLQSEAGDLLFTLVNLCRFVRVDAESALRLSLQKFIDRFSYIERKLASRGKTPEDSSLAEMDRIWEEAKKMKGTSE